MNSDLEDRLRETGVTFSALSKTEKVKLLARWTQEFPQLLASARHGQNSHNVARDKAADDQFDMLVTDKFFVLPDDASGMSSYRCQAAALPDLRELVSDTITRCDELIIVATDFGWSAVLLNHGSPQMDGRHFQVRSDQSS